MFYRAGYAEEDADEYNNSLNELNVDCLLYGRP